MQLTQNAASPNPYSNKPVPHINGSIIHSQTISHTPLAVLQKPGPRLNIKTIFPGYGDSHVKDKTVSRPSYLLHGDHYTGKTVYWYWDTPRQGLWNSLAQERTTQWWLSHMLSCNNIAWNLCRPWGNDEKKCGLESILKIVIIIPPGFCEDY